MRWIEQHIVAFRAAVIFFIVTTAVFLIGLIFIISSRNGVAKATPAGHYVYGGPLLFDFGIATTLGLLAVLILLLATTADIKK